MSGKIYSIDEDETLRALEEAPYDSEDLLQRLLATHPDVLAGDQIDAGDPRRWLLVEREYGVPDAEDASNRWSLDHLFLDQDGVPTLVEVKRSTDTRARRRVAGQMLDYAANAVRYWPVEEIRQRFRATCEARGDDPASHIARLLRTGLDDAPPAFDAFWQDVKTNLKAGRIRMLFVADRIPTELQRIVEFLNEQMDPAEVLAVEVKQYVGTDGGNRLKTLVPTVIGQTAEAQQRKGGGTRGTLWEETPFLTELEREYGNASREAVKQIFQWAREERCILEQKRGDTQGGFLVRYAACGKEHGLFKIGVDNTLAVYANHYNGTDSGDPAFVTEEAWDTLHQKMQALGLTSFPASTGESKIPSVPLPVLNDRFEQFKDTFGWVLQRHRAADAGDA